ncbi:MAG TPA: L-asparaginase 1 [Clostridiales bacterium UBA8153]|nr:L-asparaginase 1 [Clostridiales bacterium UBA8153]
MRPILLLGTGGTIASGSSAGGLRPRYTVEEILTKATGGRPGGTVETFQLMNLDSSSLELGAWVAMAEAVQARLSQYDGIVITHGTDTMAYSASALSFMLGGLDRPVVFTGSQRTLEHESSDAPANLRDALVAARSPFPGVMLAFGGLLISGVRATKLRTRGLEAFGSINAGPLGAFNDGSLQVLRQPPAHAGRPSFCMEPRVALVKLWPGLEPKFLLGLAGQGYRGLVIEAFGLGGLPSSGPGELGGVVEELVGQGVVVVVTTQCVFDGSDLTAYAVGRRARQAGALPARDMTKEAALTKLMWTLGQTPDPDRARQLFLEPVWDEITP